MSSLKRILKSSSLRASELNILLSEHSSPRHQYGSHFTSLSPQLKCHLIHETFNDPPVTKNRFSPPQYPLSLFTLLHFSLLCFLPSNILYSYFPFSYPILQQNISFTKGRTLFCFLTYTPMTVSGTHLALKELFPSSITGQHREQTEA